MQQLLPYPLIRPGLRGLNKAREADTHMGPEWALELRNAVFDDSGRVAARNGWLNVSGDALAITDGDTSFADTSLLLPFDGVGTTILDASQYGNAVTSVNGAAQTAAQSKFGGSSAFFDGSNDSMNIPVVPGGPLDLSPGDFTIEFWMRPNTVSGGQLNILSYENAADPTLATGVFTIWQNNADMYAFMDGAGVTSISSPTTLTVNTWHHIALVRYGTSGKLYVNGVGAASASPWVGAFSNASFRTRLKLGNWRFNFSFTAYQGYLDDLRITKGVARYTANFTPPTHAAPTFGPDQTAGRVRQIFEYLDSEGNADTLIASNSRLLHGFNTPEDITGALVPTADNWQFVNHNGKVYGWQDGNTPFVWSGSGDATAIIPTSGSVPTGNAACAAFGRIWAVDNDKQTIKYCALLDGLDWGSDDAGLIDMRTVWTRGMDEVVAVAAIGAKLVIFGKRHIIMFADGFGSDVGIDPLQMVVTDTIEGTGLVARDAFQAIGEGDVLYLSPTGVQSLQRALVNKNNPLTSVDTQVAALVAGYVAANQPSEIRSVYDARNKFFLLILPASGVVVCYSTAGANDDGSLRVALWDGIAPFCGCYLTSSGVLLLGFEAAVGRYSGNLDNDTPYTFSYKSPWMVLASEAAPDLEFKEKIPKRLGGLLLTGAETDVEFSWAFDFDSLNPLSGTVTFDSGRVSEYGTAEYGANGKYNVNDVDAVAGVDVAEYGGALTLTVTSQPMSGSGRWIQVGVSSVINGNALTLQQLDLYAKLGRGVR